jgi:hypothetical protein
MQNAAMPECHYAECRYTECVIFCLSIVTMNGVITNVVTPNDVALVLRHKDIGNVRCSALQKQDSELFFNQLQNEGQQIDQ